ncbi:IS30 family transposase [Succinimonas sp.]|uniref:IS30 family transposase n=1 Tax=Succinimonas sp. TaxID=1936151 RepID=UPI00386C528F
MNQRKHLTLQDRQTIELMLNAKKDFTEIARAIGKYKGTISREVRTHAEYIRVGAIGVGYNACKNRYECQKARICFRCESPRKFKHCRRCSLCNQRCPDFEKEICPRHSKPPYVCNGCGKRTFCTLEKRIYASSKAHEEYRDLLSSSRTGCSYAEEEILRLDRLISPLIQRGQSPHHVYATNNDSIMVSERTIYRLIDSSTISARNLDLPRKVKFKARRKKKEYKVDKACRIGRDFSCFQRFMDENPSLPVIQLDTVEGKKGGKALLTVHFVMCEMMLAFLRDANTAKSVSDIFDMLYRELGADEFRSIFRVCLADNGSEFSNPSAIEFDPVDSLRRTRVFYCDPNAPYQKGSAERNHEFIRRFIPKGVDIGQYTQDDITLMMNHINSYSRESLGNKCPYDAFRFFYGDKLLILLGCTTIPPHQITLNKAVFRREVPQ